jgi:alkylation response protein AidB-like acyl-CoA dehydrogenase
MTTASADQLFALAPEHHEVREMVREFVERRIEPNAAAWDRDHHFDRSLYNELGELGLMGVCVPAEYGGAGMDFLSYVVALEELSRGDAGVGVTVAVHTSAATLPILHWGTEQQKQEFVPRMAIGEWIGAFALTEPGSGSDAGAMRTTATQIDSGWRIDGSKQWITNGSHAGVFVAFARSESDVAGAKGVSCFLVDGDAAGLAVTREEEKLGLNSSSTADIAFDGVEVAADRMMAPRGEGFKVAMQTLDGGRIGIAAQAVGIAQAAFDTAAAYVLEREQFGQKLADFQATKFRLADMATEIEAARALTYRAAARKQAGLPHTLEGAQAKLFASRVAQRQTSEAIQQLGGYGYTKEFPVERYYRDAKVTEIYEGTSEIQRIVIARHLLGLQSR